MGEGEGGGGPRWDTLGASLPPRHGYNVSYAWLSILVTYEGPGPKEAYDQVINLAFLVSNGSHGPCRWDDRLPEMSGCLFLFYFVFVYSILTLVRLVSHLGRTSKYVRVHACFLKNSLNE